MTWGKTVVAAAVLVAASFGLGFVHPGGNPRGGFNGERHEEIAGFPEDVKGIVENKCGDCHSDRTRWPVYSRFAPVSWLIERDVVGGRNAMNLSHWEGMKAEERISALTRIAAEVRAGGMPPRGYAFMHSEKRVTPAEQQTLIGWARAERRRIRQATDQQGKDIR